MEGHRIGRRVEKGLRRLVQKMKTRVCLLPNACLSQERQWKHTGASPILRKEHSPRGRDL